MRRMLAFAAAAVVAVVAVLVVSDAGSAASRTTVKTRSTSLGTVLVGARSRTVYFFDRDKTTRSTCTSACAQAWPPVLTSGAPRAAGSARSRLLGTTRRRDGKRQVTYRGHPLYYYIGDAKAGDVNGEGLNAFGARWWVVAPSGRRIKSAPPAPAPAASPTPYPGY
jgi:predicted lipoprotein with Yx(FWY)xxD motif